MYAKKPYSIYHVLSIYPKLNDFVVNVCVILNIFLWLCIQNPQINSP